MVIEVEVALIFDEEADLDVEVDLAMVTNCIVNCVVNMVILPRTTTIDSILIFKSQM